MYFNFVDRSVIMCAHLAVMLDVKLNIRYIFLIMKIRPSWWRKIEVYNFKSILYHSNMRQILIVYINIYIYIGRVFLKY